MNSPRRKQGKTRCIETGVSFALSRLWAGHAHVPSPAPPFRGRQTVKRFFDLRSRDIVVVVAASMFMAQLDAAVLAIALPAIARDFAVPAVSLSLAITIYLIMLVGLLPISGWIADRFGARRVFLLATAGFALFSLLCASAESFWPFILGRAGQGMAASLLTPVGRLILLRETPKDELVDALAITAMPMLVAPTIGPLLGGIIVDYLSWHYIFLLNLPVAAFLLAHAWLRIPDYPAEPARRFDLAGAVLLTCTLLCLLTGLDRLAGGMGRVLPWGLMALGAGLAYATLRHLARSPHPILSLDALRIPGFRTASIGAGAAVRIPARATLFALPLMFQIGFGYSPFMAGLLLMALAGGDLLFKPLVKPAFDRFGYRQTVVFSSLIGIAALLVVALAEAGPWLAPLLVGLLLLSGIARSFLFTGIATLSFATLDRDTMSSGNVLASISMQLFNAVAISATAVMLSVSAQLGGRDEPELLDYRIALIAVVAIGLAATLSLRRTLPRDLAEIHPEEPV